ncbi:extracellular solute-binding protein [Paenibacillus alkaliterrae]|uniref:extracellular solute-binding protein n=1 Tax=Paenibacillus alkaliterrae TaxID=320909 RepID=UPI001F3F8A86|nr:extracellular solute-binding protein [Paenibacillus alkaliterrae]MCF2937713.1 extracellular solute-binding protein [Paenibacillus alkaliterrae]
MNKKNQGILLLFMVMLLIISACGNANNSPNNTGANNNVANETKNPDNPPDPFGKYEEPVTISIGMEVDPTDQSLPAGDTPSDNQYTRNVKENLNINVEHAFTASGANMPQKISLAIASDDLPDAMVVGPIELRQMVEADQLADLTEVYKNYASPTIKGIIEGTDGAALKAVTFDGKIMAIPGVQLKADGIHTMWIRQDWLDKLGLEPPKTIEDLEKVARAFVEQDPDGNGTADTIGISGPQSGDGKMYANFLESKNNLYGFDAIFSAFGAYPGFWIEGDDGKPVYGSILPETKEALIKLSEMYADGLIDPEMAVRKDSKEPVVNGKSGMFFAPWWMGYGPISDAVKNDPKANWQAYALPLNAEGKFSPHVGTPSSEFVVVRKGYEHPEAPMKMLNNLFKGESEATFDPSKGGPGFYPLRLVYAPSDETEYTVKAIREVLAGTKTPEDYADDVEYKLLASDLLAIKKVKKEPFDQMGIETWDPSADMGIWTRAYSIMIGGTPLVDTEMVDVPSLIYEQTPLMESRWVNMKKMEDEMFLKIVMGAASADSFDQFVADWKKQGGDQITQEVIDAVNQ